MQGASAAGGRAGAEEGTSKVRAAARGVRQAGGGGAEDCRMRVEVKGGGEREGGKGMEGRAGLWQTGPRAWQGTGASAAGGQSRG